MGRIDETAIQTKLQYEECFLSELCDYLDQKHYVYRVMYRAWVDTPDVPLFYDGGAHQTRCDLAIFLRGEQEPIHLFFTFKFNPYAYKLEYRSQALLRDTRNGVRKRDPDYHVARTTVREDRNAIYCFVIRNLMENSDPNDYKKRIIATTFRGKNTTVGAAIRNLLEQQNQKKPEK